MIKALAMLGAIKKKARVRRDVEWCLAQAIVLLQVHPAFVAKKMPQGKEKVWKLHKARLSSAATIVTKDFRSLAVLN